MISAALAVLKTDEQRNELSEFYEQNKSKLYSIALERVHNRQDAEDAVQQAFLEIAAKPDKFFEIPTANRLAYVGIIARNIAIDMFKIKNKMMPEQLSEEIKVDAISLENSLFDKISRDEVVLFINQLPNNQRNVLMLRGFFGLSIDETSQRLNISLTSANKHLTLSRRKIRNFLEERSKQL